MFLISFLHPFKYPNTSCGYAILFLYFGWQTSIRVSCYLVSTRKSEFFHQLYAACKSCSSIFNTQWVLTHTNQRDFLVQTYACQYRFLLVCFYYLFFHWLYILNIRAFSTGLLMFLVLPSTYSVIYSEKYFLYLGKF